MNFISNPDLRQQLVQAIRSGGQDGLTTAQDVRTFLGQLLDELEATESAQATKADLGPNGQVLPDQLPAVDQTGLVHLEGAETITGPKTFAASLDVPALTTAGSQLALQQNGDEYGPTRLTLLNRYGFNGALFENLGLDLVDFGFKTSEGGDFRLRFEHRSQFWGNSNNTNGEFQLRHPVSGAPTSHFNTFGEYAALFRNGQRVGINTDYPTELLEVNGRVKATAFIGDGSQLTGLPAAELPANKGVANGYAPLDATAKVPAANLPPYPVGVSQDQVNILAGRFIVSSAGVVRTYTDLKTTVLNTGDTVYLPYNGYIVSYNQAIKFANVTIVGNNCTLGIDNGIGWVFTNCQVRNLTLAGTQGKPSGALNDETTGLINSTFTDCAISNVALYNVPGYANGSAATPVPSTVVFDNVNASTGTYLNGITLKGYGTSTFPASLSNGASIQDYRPRATSINQLLLSAQMPGGASTMLQLAHGLAAGNIVSITALAYGGTVGLFVPPGFTVQPNLEYYCYLNGANVVVATTANSTALFNGGIQLCITYKVS